MDEYFKMSYFNWYFSKDRDMYEIFGWKFKGDFDGFPKTCEKV